jgi:hypothetical protein
MNKSLNAYALAKGNLLVIKAPPYYKQEYVYEVISAGDKQVRAQLQNSPRVRKIWSTRELQVLFQAGVARQLADGEDKPVSEI